VLEEIPASAAMPNANPASRTWLSFRRTRACATQDRITTISAEGRPDLLLFPKKDDEVALLQRYHDEDAVDLTPATAG
jgi:hypothetical protein